MAVQQEVRDGGQQRPMTEEEKKRLETAQEAIKAILEEYGVSLIPLITLGPAGVIEAKIGAVLVPHQNRILVPKFNPNNLRGKSNGT